MSAVVFVMMYFGYGLIGFAIGRIVFSLVLLISYIILFKRSSGDIKEVICIFPSEEGMTTHPE